MSCLTVRFAPAMLPNDCCTVLTQGVCHRELNLESALLHRRDARSALQIKVCEFGLSRVCLRRRPAAGQCSLFSPCKRKRIPRIRCSEARRLVWSAHRGMLWSLVATVTGGNLLCGAAALT